MLITLEGSPPDTPVLDALADPTGRAWLPSRQLEPNLATLFTGQLPPAHGLTLGGHQRLAEHHTTLAEQALASGFTTAAYTGTVRTRQGQGLHQGFATVADHERHDPEAEPAGALAASVAPPTDRPSFTWVHLDEPSEGVLRELVSGFREAHPEGRLAVVGLEGAPSVHLDDAALGVPLRLLPAPGWGPDATVGLPDLHAWLADGLTDGPPHGPTRQVVHHDGALRTSLGGPVQQALTVSDGRYSGPAPSRWHAVGPAGHTALGQPLPPDATPHDEALRAALATPGSASPRTYPSPWEVQKALVATPWVLADPDQPEDGRTAEQLGAAVEGLEKGRRAFLQRRFAEVDRAVATPGLEGTPAATWLLALARRGEGRLDAAATALEEGHQRSSGPTFALLRARVAVDALDPATALAWVRRAQDSAPDPREVEPRAALLLAETRLIPELATAPPPEALATWSARLLAEGRDEGTVVRALLDPGHASVLEEVEGLARRHPDRGEVRLAHALALWHRGRTAEAEERLRALVGDEPDRTAARLLLAAWDEELGQADEAIRLVGVIARRHPEHEALQAWFDRLRSGYGWQERKDRQADRAFNRP